MSTSHAPDPIHVRDLCFRWQREPLYASLGLQARVPGIYALFGPNGSGKSTLLKLLAGLLTPDAGKIRVLGHDPRRRAPDFLQQIHLVPEAFELPNLEARQLKRSHGRFYPQFSPSHFNEYLQVLRVPSDRRFGTMSLGQKKKAVLAYALAVQTPVLLMDEPSNGLDITSRRQLQTLLLRPEQRERVIVISTHQARDLEGLLSHVWFIKQGRLLLSSSMAALQTHIAVGVARSEDELPAAGKLLYRESVGSETVWVARRQPHMPTAPVQIALLHKALSENPDATVAAMEVQA